MFVNIFFINYIYAKNTRKKELFGRESLSDIFTFSNAISVECKIQKREGCILPFLYLQIFLVEAVVADFFKAVFAADVRLSLNPLAVGEVGDRYRHAAHGD